MKQSIIALALAGALSTSLAHAADYTIDTKGAHAAINVEVSHLGYSLTQGRFNTFEGEFSYDANNVEASQVRVSVDTSSLDSNHAERDKHIRSGKFLDADAFPTATFTSTQVTDLGNGQLKVDGSLYLHGVRKPITIHGEFIGEGQDPWGGYRAGFKGTTRLMLKDFGIPVMGATSYADMTLHIEGIRK